jgi:hypothetical protein
MERNDGQDECKPSNEALVEPRGNPTTERPYCWQSKAALRIIRASFGDDRRLPYLMSAYMALGWIASDEGRPTFTKSVSEILSKAGGSDRMLRWSLGQLECLRLLHVRHNFISKNCYAPSTYTLLSVRHDAPDPHAQYAAPLCTDDDASCAALINNANAITLKNRVASTQIPVPKTEEEMYDTLDSLGIESDPSHDGQFFQQMERIGWKIHGEPVFDWSKAYQARLAVTSPRDFPNGATP